jgi:hypothetical protein
MPDTVFYDERTRHLGHPAFRLLCELMQQYNGFNNGNLSATPKTLAHEFSESTLKRAKRELLKAELAMITRPGVGRRPTLYALTFFPIDECKKHGISATQNAPLRAHGKRKHFFPVKVDATALLTEKLNRATKEREGKEANSNAALERANAAIAKQKMGAISDQILS